jgi:thioredoxin reductase (NADPH)
VAIIGGGSAGLGLALAGSKLGLRMVVFDYIVPSPRGSTWGLGGTCVNVGCIPKKLMHQAALLGEAAMSSKPYGWNFGFNDDPSKHEDMVKHFSWETLRQNVQNHIKAQNFGYKTSLSKDKTLYLNALAAFKDGETLYYSNDKEILKEAIRSGDGSKCGEVKFKYCVVCVGGRPTVFKPVEDVAITSDDVFSLKQAPGKTLVIGGGYIALETAGLLTGLGYPVTIMTRGKYLRGS